MYKLERSLRRKKIDCIVDFNTHWYAGLSSDLLKEIPYKELLRNVQDEYCSKRGIWRQWYIFVK